jgi:hypothetical protein
MKSFATNTSIIKDRHYFLDFDYQIEESWAFLNSNKCFSVIMPPASGKTTLLLNLQTYIHKNTRDSALYMDFTDFNRNSMSTFDKFLLELKDLFLKNARYISNYMVKLVEATPLSNRDELIEFLIKIKSAVNGRLYLLIDNAEKHMQHDSFSLFLGLLLKKMNDMQNRSGASFDAICVATTKNINNFKPFERGLDDPEFFLTWTYKNEFTKAIEINEVSLRVYLADYTAEIGFDLEPSVAKELLEKCQGSILNINKILKFFDEKLKPYKKQKILTVAEIQNAAGYVIIPSGPRR